jgi:hypothetical protein
VALLAGDIPAMRTPTPPMAVRPVAPAAPAAPPAAPVAPPMAIPPRRSLERPAVPMSQAPAGSFPAWPAAPSVEPEPAPPSPRRAPSAEPSGESLRAFLQDGIAGLRRLEDQPMSTPSIVPNDDGTVPIDQLLYRGRAALERAAELRHEWQAAGTPPTPEDVAELFDLLDLALVE